MGFAVRLTDEGVRIGPVELCRAELCDGTRWSIEVWRFSLSFFYERPDRDGWDTT